MVKAGFGRSILSRWAVQTYLNNQKLVAMPITDQGMPVYWSALVRKNHPHMQLLNAMASQLPTWCQLNFSGTNPP